MVWFFTKCLTWDERKKFIEEGCFLLCQIPNFNETCVLMKMGANCHTLIGYLAVYRVAFSMVVFHGVLMVFTLGVSTSGSWRASIHNGYVDSSSEMTRTFYLFSYLWHLSYLFYLFNFFLFCFLKLIVIYLNLSDLF